MDLPIEGFKDKTWRPYNGVSMDLGQADGSVTGRVTRAGAGRALSNPGASLEKAARGATLSSCQVILYPWLLAVGKQGGPGAGLGWAWGLRDELPARSRSKSCLSQAFFGQYRQCPCLQNLTCVYWKSEKWSAIAFGHCQKIGRQKLAEEMFF